jgi:hypothetical protein
LHGDGRKVIEAANDGEFDVIMLDAFSSDSVPAHLLSLEALRIYVSKLKPNGILMFHVSNRYLRVDRPVSAGVIHAGLVGFYRSDRDISVMGKTGSDFVVAARRVEDLGAIATDPRWRQIRPDTTVAPWTDDYSNLLSIVRWY